ncbi:MAG: Sec-independent protein translocase protein TatB [Pseudomonas sp.]
MFDIGFLEMMVVAFVALLVLGPEKLPSAVRMAGLYLGRIKGSLAEVRSQVEREIGADELRQTLHNEKVMADLAKKPGSSNVKRAVTADTSQDAEQPTSSAAPIAPAATPDSEPDSSATPNDDPASRT